MLAKLRAATFEVLETMFFLFPEALEEDDLVRSRGPFLHAWVAITGPQSLKIGLVVPQTLVRKMAANFLGATEAEIQKLEMEDILKETTNMLAGAFLSKLEGSTAFKLQTPEAKWLAAEEQLPKKSANRLRFEVDEDVMELVVERN